LARVKYNNSDVNLLGRLIRSEAVGEGKYGMKLVGNVVINRVITKCSGFKNINTIYKAVYQKNAFDGTKRKLFYGPASNTEKKLAKECIISWKGTPAVHALFFKNPGSGKSCPSRFYGKLAGRYKKHCFYQPDNINKCGI